MTEIIILLYLQATKMSVVSHAVPSMPGAHCPDELSVRGAAGTGAKQVSRMSLDITPPSLKT